MTRTTGSSDEFTRRGLLRITGGLVAMATIGSSTAAAQEPADFGGWFDDVGNFDGVEDNTGKNEVTVMVGSEANDGFYGYDPPAIRVSPGTTVVWKWTGDGGGHNVVAESGGFESELTAEAGFTFSRTFDEPGVFKYYCLPHKGLGMKGAVVVGDVAVNETPSSGGSSGDQTNDAGTESPSGITSVSEISTRDFVFMSMVGISGVAALTALLPDIGFFAMTASRPASRTGYVIHRLNRFRQSWIFSVIVGWSSFLAVMLMIGALFVVLWELGGTVYGFMGGLFVCAIVVAGYILSSSR